MDSDRGRRALSSDLYFGDFWNDTFNYFEKLGQRSRSHIKGHGDLL